MVGDKDGNIYNIGYHQNLVMRWGNELTTQMKEDQGTAGAISYNPTQAIETQICVSKMKAAVETIPSCLTTCSGSTDDASIDTQSCFIDGKCYAANESTNAFGKSCDISDPAVSQWEWTEGPPLVPLVLMASRRFGIIGQVGRDIGWVVWDSGWLRLGGLLWRAVVSCLAVAVTTPHYWMWRMLGW
mmetsp:Transcript_35883/g.64627  ORF Transcript_35883/g.64627 Transcript_35883/m.64627 type:complete len:186 (+) Transcript_35883:951-1508(+)